MVCTKIEYVNNTIDENKRTKKLPFQARFSSHYIENCFFRKSVLIWNQIHNANSDIISSSLTYKTMIFKFREMFLSIFREDPSMTTHGKRKWKQFKFV